MDRTTTIAVAVLAAVAVGCASSESSESGAGGGDRGIAVPSGDPDAPVTDAPMPVDPGIGGDTGEPQQVEPRAGMANVHPVGWDEATVDREAGTVTLVYWSGVEPCNVLDHVDVDYGADAVTITLFEGNDPGQGDVACIEIAVQKQVTVELEEDIGQRSLVDGAD